MDSLEIFFDSQSEISHYETSQKLRQAKVTYDESFESGRYKLWLEPVLRDDQYGDPEKKERPEFFFPGRTS